MYSLPHSIAALLDLQRSIEQASMASLWPTALTSGQGVFPPINVFEQDHGVVIVAEIPGVAKEDITLVVRHDRIRLSGHKRIDYAKQTSVHRQERRHGEFDRTFSVPFNVDAAQVSAQHQLGILTIYLPRAESDKPHAIKIEN